MMKSFFKKLAFVMALAMVVTMAAPAAKVAVAADKALAVTYQNENHYSINEVNLANVGDKEDLKFLWAPSNWKELGVKWTSSNENVVTVDSAGIVTAVAAGSADVTVAIGTDSATVTVNVEKLPTYTVSIGEGEKREVTEWELEIGESVDFAFYGIKDYARDKVGTAGVCRYACQWGTDDPTVISNDGNGVFTALKAGTAKATLMVINVITNQIHNVIPVNVTVKEKAPVAPAFEVVNLKAEEMGVEKKLNTTQNTVKLRFAKATDVDLKKIQAWEMFVTDDDHDEDGDLEMPEHLYEYHTLNVYSVTPDDDTKTVWTVTMFDDFVDDVRYKFDPDGDGGYNAEEFVASVGEVATVEVVELQTALLEHADLSARPAVLDVALYDAEWADVTTRVVDGVINNDPANIYYTVPDNTNYSYGNDWVTWVNDWKKANAEMGECIFAEHHYMKKDHYHFTVDFYEDAIAPVTATYACKNVEKNSYPYNVKPEDQSDYDPGKVIRWTLVEPGKTADWTKVNHVIPANELGYTIAALILDGRGNYFTTHEASAGVDKFTDTNGVKHTVYWTEDETEDFWSNGYYVKYRAMNPDKMLIEEAGGVESYAKADQVYFSLYLYDYRKDGDDFVRQFYANTITVCHPKELKDVTADKTVYVMTNTQEHETGVANAYWSIFSKGTVNVKLNDIHGGEARADHAAAAELEIKLELNKSKEDIDFEELERLVQEDFLGQLNATNGAKRKIEFSADQLTALTKRGQVKFRITEKTTKTSVLVTIMLVKPATMEDGSAQVFPVNEYNDAVKEVWTYDNFFPVGTKDIKVGQRLSKPSTLGTDIFLAQVDKNGNPIGFDNNLFMATTLDVNDVESVYHTAGSVDDELSVGDRVIFIKGPDGKIFAPLGTAEYKNPAYTKAEALQYPMTEATTAFGVVVVDGGDAVSASGSAVDFYQYKLITKTVNPFNDDEIILAQNGTYKVTIRTVKDFKDVDKDGRLEAVFTTSTSLKSEFTVNVNNVLAPVTVKSRDLNKIKAALPANLEGSYSGNDINKYNSRKTGNDVDMKQYILDAITFNWAEEADEDGDGYTDDGTYKLSPEDILYYTYTVAPTNKQIVINSVCFRVRANVNGGLNWNKDAAVDTSWYRSEVDINWHLTFTE